MINKRRDFLKFTGLAGLTAAGGLLNAFNPSTASQLSAPILPATQGGQLYDSDPKIKADFDTAINILKPSRKHLEHGLELHRNAIVIDAYGFMPRAALDGNAVAAAMKANASALEIQDMREDMPMTRFIFDEKEREIFKNAWLAAGVTCVFQNAGEEGNDIKRLLKRFARFTYSTDMMSDFVAKAVTPEDIVRAKKENRRVLYFSGNGVPLPMEFISPEEELRYIRIFFQMGIRMMHLTYNRRNLIGDGCAEPANGGLSDFGRAVVKEMNKVGVIVDIAHSGWQTSLEAAKVSGKPMVASHTTVASVYKHIRSKPDEVIRAIADTGGYVGICTIPRFLGGTGDISSMMQHIDYVVKKFGSDHVAIGTDTAYSSPFSGNEEKKIPRAPQTHTRWEALWPPDNFVETPRMLDSVAWTNWPLFTVGLVQLGYPDDVIQKIIGGNTLRVARAAIAE